MPTLDASVVVCSHNGAAHLPAVLASLRGQTFDPERFETLVVDDGSDDATSIIAAEHDVRVVTLAENCGLAAARNAGVRAARAPVIVFTDDDCVCEPGWLAQLLTPFADPAVLAVSGDVVPAGPDSFNVRFLQRRNPLAPLPGVFLDVASPARRLAVYVRGLIYGPPRPDPGERLYSLVGANMALRRELVIELGGFDEAFRFGSEEKELCIRIHARDAAAEIVFAPQAVVSHTFAPRLTDTLRRARAYGRGNAREATKYGRRRVTPFPVPLLVGVLAAGALRARNARLALLAAFVPWLTYPRWLTDLADARNPEPLTYPYLQLAQELLTVVGEIEGLRAGYRPVAAVQLAGSPMETAQRSRVSP